MTAAQVGERALGDVAGAGEPTSGATEPDVGATEPDAGATEPADPSRRFRRVAAVAVAVAAVPYLWALFDLWNGSVDLLRTNGPGGLGQVYDVQARAILHGRLSLPTGSIGPEAFIHDGRTYTYFGIFPSLIRIPVLLVTHAFDGKLTALSLFAAWLVTALAAAGLLWRVRVLVRGPAELGWAEACSYGAVLATVLAGSVLVYLASQPDVYSEDMAWSVALGCASLLALLRVAEQPSRGRVVALLVAVTCTNLNRATTGYAAVIGCVLLAAWLASGRAGPERQRWGWAVAGVAFVALAAGCLVDLAKFDLLFGFPAADQVLYKGFGLSQVNHGHYFALRFLPATLFSYLFPGNLRLSALFPYVTLPSLPAHLIDHTPLFGHERVAATTVTTPLLVVLTLGGVVAAFRPHRADGLRAVRVPLLAATATAGTVLVFGWIAERFTGDFLPLLVVGSAVGSVALWHRLAGRNRRWRRLVAGATVTLGLWSVVASVGVAAVPDANWTQAQSHHFVSFQHALSNLTGHPLSHHVVTGSHLPGTAPVGELFVLDRCKALYVSDGTGPPFPYPDLVWLPVERAPDVRLCESVARSATLAPAVARLLVPSSGARLSGVVPLDGLAGSGDTVTSVTFELAGGGLAAPRTVGTGKATLDGWLTLWDTRTVPDGTYRLWVVARDSGHRTARSAAVTVTVTNAAPPTGAPSKPGS